VEKGNLLAKMLDCLPLYGTGASRLQEVTLNVRQTQSPHVPDLQNESHRVANTLLMVLYELLKKKKENQFAKSLPTTHGMCLQVTKNNHFSFLLLTITSFHPEF
jgi:hypothetical protein